VCDNIRLTQKKDCRMATCWNSNLYDGHDDSGPVLEEEEEVQPQDSFCLLEPTPGACKSSSIQQWFFNATEATCARFMYTGCGGNKNNFHSESECLAACNPHQAFRGLQSQSLTREGFLQDEAPDPADCQVSAWSVWSGCSASCGRGWLARGRAVLREAAPGGRPCPRCPGCQVSGVRVSGVRVSGVRC
jgi:hypothetical protein